MREDRLDALPPGRAVWVLGSANRFGPKVVASLGAAGATVDETEARFGAEFVPRAAHSFVYVARNPADAKCAAGWVGSEVAAAIPGLRRMSLLTGRVGPEHLEPPNGVQPVRARERDPRKEPGRQKPARGGGDQEQDAGDDTAGR